jgi:hypothetical protein
MRIKKRGRPLSRLVLQGEPSGRRRRLEETARRFNQYDQPTP